MYYLNYFFVFSIIGHIIESFIYYNGESGILFGWWTPIYGIGIILILLTNKLINKLRINEFIKVILLFIISAILLSIIEVFGGYLIEWFFGFSFWDYSDYKYNIGKYAALEMAIIWGICSVIIYFVEPFLDKIISKIPKYFTYILTILFIIDVFLTIFIKH